MYVTKGGTVQKINDDTLPYWRDLGWSVDQDRDGLGDFAAGGQRRGFGTALIGDSTGANYGGTATTGPDNYLSWALIKAQGKGGPFRGIYASGGLTMEQVRDQKLPQVLALAVPPRACVVLAGTNNVPDGADPSTNLRTYEALLTRGIQPVAVTLPPRGDNAAVNNNVDLFNRRLRAGAAQLGIVLADVHKAMTNPATGSYKTGLGQTDLIHPSFKGTIAAADEIAAALAALFPYESPPLARRPLEYGNLIGSAGLMLTDALATGNNTAADGIADNWRDTGSASNVRTIQADPDGERFQRITIPAAGGSVSMAYNSGGGGLSLAGVVSPGDMVELCMRVRTTGFEENFVAPSVLNSGGTGPTWSVLLEALQTDGSTYGSLSRYPYVGHANVDGVLWAATQVPADANGTLRLTVATTGVPATGNLVLDFGRVAVRNLTRLGAV